MIIVRFVRWVLGTLIGSFIVSFPVALAIVALTHIFGSGWNYWETYKIVFWVLIVIDILADIVKTWE